MGKPPDHCPNGASNKAGGRDTYEVTNYQTDSKAYEVEPGKAMPYRKARSLFCLLEAIFLLCFEARLQDGLCDRLGSDLVHYFIGLDLITL